MQKQLTQGIAMDDDRVDLTAPVIKAKSVNWLASSWQALEKRPEIAINGFRRAGILGAVIAMEGH